MSWKNLCLFSLLCIVILFLGPSHVYSKEVFVNQSFDFGTIKKVIVLPFVNLTEDRSAGDVIRYLVVSELQELVETVFVGDVDRVLKRMNVSDVRELAAEQIKEICKELKADAVITGVVYKYGEARSGNISYPEVVITINMVEPEGGSIVWSVTERKSGGSFLAKHFGLGIRTLNELAIEAVKDAIKTLKNI